MGGKDRLNCFQSSRTAHRTVQPVAKHAVQ